RRDGRRNVPARARQRAVRRLGEQAELGDAAGAARGGRPRPCRRDRDRGRADRPGGRRRGLSPPSRRRGRRSGGGCPLTLEGIRGKVAVVTGGGSGLGEAICRRLAAEEVRVAALDVNEEAAKRTAESVGGAGIRADVTDSESVD